MYIYIYIYIYSMVQVLRDCDSNNEGTTMLPNVDNYFINMTV